MNLLEHTSPLSILFFMLYAGAMTLCVVLCLYLLLSRVNVIAPGTMLAMLQDRRRSVWPVVVASLPIAVLGALQMACPDCEFLVAALVYTLAVYVAFTIYMVVAVRQYGRWLRDNYADLEHKEVWLSHVLLLLLLLLVVVYGFAADAPSLLLLRIADFVLFVFLLWRVETLPQLDAAPRPIMPAQTEQPSADPVSIDVDLMELLLKNTAWPRGSIWKTI